MHLHTSSSLSLTQLNNTLTTQGAFTGNHRAPTCEERERERKEEGMRDEGTTAHQRGQKMSISSMHRSKEEERRKGGGGRGKICRGRTGTGNGRLGAKARTPKGGGKEGEREKNQASSIQVTTLNSSSPPTRSPPINALTYSLPRIHIAPALSPTHPTTLQSTSNDSPSSLHSSLPHTSDTPYANLSQQLNPQQPLTPSPSPITTPSRATAAGDTPIPTDLSSHT